MVDPLEAGTAAPSAPPGRLRVQPNIKILAAIVTALAAAVALGWYLSGKGDSAGWQLTGKSIQAGSGPAGLAFSPDGASVYVPNWADGTMSVIDTAARKTLGNPIRLGTLPGGIAVSPDGAFVYVLSAEDGDNTIRVIKVANP